MRRSLFTGVPLGRQPVARANDHHGAPDGSDRDHLPVYDRYRNDGWVDQDRTRRRLPQLVQSRPYYQQGGDMVRVGGLRYTREPKAKIGARISDLRLGEKMIEGDKKYKVAGWAPVSEKAKIDGEVPVWEVMAKYLREQKTVTGRTLNLPRLKGVEGNPAWPEPWKWAFYL